MKSIFFGKLFSFSLVFYLFLTQTAFAQSIVQGRLVKSDGKPVPYASVTIRNEQNKIIAYKTSNEEGKFNITLPTNQNTATLKIYVNHLGYKIEEIPYENGKSFYEIIMTEKAINLEEVAVKSRPRIDSRGDTLSYDVGSFAQSEDRTIGDVIKRLPGMEVSESGEIKYNGKSLSNFYLDGDDLLGGKYNIGTKTIPHAMIQKLEVLQNHQPMKVLKNKVFSDQVAINLVIKDEAKLKLTGQVKVGAGLPNQFDTELSTILFNKKYKMLNVLKGNNVGVDLNSDFQDFFSSMSASGSKPGSILSTGTVGNPNLAKHHYFLNNSGSITANNLVNTSKNWQFKTNINGLLDVNESTYSSKSEIYLGNDTIRYQENQYTENKPFLMDISLDALKNDEKYYFKNSFKLGYSGQGTQANLTNQSGLVSQRYGSFVRDFSNTLTYIPQVSAKKVITINWNLGYYERPENLWIEPGLNADIFNDSLAYLGSNQWTRIPSWSNRLSVGYRQPIGKISQYIQLGISNEWQTMESELRLKQEDQQFSEFTASSDNRLDWQKHQAFLLPSYEYKWRKLETSLNLPVTFQKIQYRDGGFQLDETNNRVLFNPNLRMKWMVNAEDHVNINYGFSNNIGGITGIYRGAILSNYRSLRSNDAALQDRWGQSISMNYNFQRAIKMLFINAGINYSQSMENTISSSIMDNNISKSILIPFENDVSTLSASMGISKYIFALGATTALKGSWSTSRMNQFINGEILPYRNETFVINPTLEARLFNKIAFNYDLVNRWSVSTLMKESNHQDQHSMALVQNIGFTLNPIPYLNIRLSTRHQYFQQPQQADMSYWFADAFVRYKIIKWKTDLELNLNNLANVKDYKTYSISANQWFMSQYDLRGRMAVLKFIFNL